MEMKKTDYERFRDFDIRLRDALIHWKRRYQHLKET